MEANCEAGGKRTRDELSSTSSVESNTQYSAKQPRMAKDDLTLEAVYEVLKDIQSNTVKLVEDNKLLRKDLDDMKAALNFQSAKVDELTKENQRLKTQGAELKSLLRTCQDETRITANKVEELEEKNDDLEMYTRKFNLEIHGVPEAEDEDLEAVVIKVAEYVGVDLDEDEIDIVHRLPTKLGSIRPIIVRFLSHKVKSQIYLARRKLKSVRSFNPVLNGSVNIYINENLTATKRKLYAEVRKRAKLNKWYNTWTMDGKIFICQEKGKRAVKISKQADLELLY